MCFEAEMRISLSVQGGKLMTIQAHQWSYRRISFFLLVLSFFVLPVVAQDARDVVLKGDAHAGKGAWAEALAEYRRAVTIDPEKADYRARLGAALGKLGNSEEALLEFLEGLRLDPKSGFVYRSLGEYYLDLGHWNASAVSYNKAVRLSPSDSEAHYGLGIALAAQDKFAEASEAFSKAVSLAPDKAEYIYGLAKVESRREKWKQAEANFRLAMEKSSDEAFKVRCVNSIGNLFGAQGRWSDAEAEFRKAVSLDSKDGRSLANLAMALYRRQSRKEAWRTACQALQLGYTGPHEIYTELGIDPAPVMTMAPLISDRRGVEGIDSELLSAVMSEDSPRATAALVAGADPEAREDARRAIEIAAEYGDAATIRTLMDYGADGDAAAGGDAPVILAVRSGSPEAVRTLLEAGFDTKCGPEGSAILAAIEGQADKPSIEIVRTLTQVGAEVNVSTKETGLTPLMWAVQSDSSELVKLLIEAGADAVAKDRNGRTALDYAKAKGNSDMVGLLSPLTTSAAPQVPGDAIRLKAGADLLTASRTASSGQTIVLSAGKYYGPIYVAGKKLAIIGDSGGSSVIAPHPEGKPRLMSNGDPYAYVAKDGALDLWNVRFEGSPASNGAALVQGGALRLRSCVFENLSKTACIAQQASVLVHDCRFDNLKGDVGVFLSESTGIVRGTQFTNVNQACIRAGKGSNLNVANSTFTKARMGASAFDRSVMRISHCKFENVDRGLEAGGVELVAVTDSRFTEGTLALVDKSAGTVVRRNTVINTKIAPKSTGIYVQNSRGTLILDNRIEGFVSSIAIQNNTTEPAALSRNIIRRTHRAIVLAGKSESDRPAAFVTGNRILGLPFVSETDLYGLLIDGQMHVVLSDNTILPGSSGEAIVFQNGATGHLTGNLLSTTDEAIHFHKTPSGKSTLTRELIIDGVIKTYQSGAGPVSRSGTERLDAYADWSPRARLLRRLIFEQPGSAEDVSQEDLAAFLSRVDEEHKAAVAEASEYGTVRLEVRDRIGKTGPLPFKVYDRQSPVSGFTTFTLDQVVDPEQLIDTWKVKDPASIKDPIERAMERYESSDKVLAYLRKNAHPTTQKLVGAYREDSAPSEILVLAIVMELNRFLESEEFVGNAESEEAVSLAALHRSWFEWKQIHEQNLSEDEKKTRIRKFNRKLLEDVFKFGVAQSGPILLTRTAPALPAGMYVIESGSTTGITTDVAFGPEIDVIARARVNDGLWLAYGGYNSKTVDLLRLRPRYEMQRAIGKLRFAWAEPGFAMRRAGADAASVKEALDIARRTLSASENKRVHHDFYLAMRIFSAVGESEDCGRIVESSRKAAGTENAWTFKDKLACAAVIGRIDAAHGRLTDGTLFSLLKDSDRDWAVAAAIDLHRNGLETGDNLLHEELTTGGSFERAAPAGLVLLDSLDPRTLDAMRALWDRIGKEQDLDVKGEIEENPSLAPMLYLLAFGNTDDWERISRFRLYSEHVKYLTLLAKNPSDLMRMTAENMNLGFRMDDQAFYRLAEGYFDRPYSQLRNLIGELDRQSSSVIFENKPETPRDSPYNTSRVYMSPFLPNRTVAAVYADIGRWGPQPAPPHPMFSWWKKKEFVPGYVSRWLKGTHTYQDQLSYFSPDEIAQEVAKQGEGKKPPDYELFMAYVRVATREHTHPYMRSEGYESRPYLARHGSDSGLSGVAHLRFDWKGDVLQIGVRLTQDRTISGGFLADPEDKRAHYPFILDRGRKMIQSVMLRHEGKKIEATAVEATEDESFFLFEASPKVDNRDLSGWYLDVEMKYVDQGFTLTTPLFFGENARRLRTEARLQKKEGI